MYYISICYDIFITYESFNFFECIQIQNCQNMLHHHHPNAKLSNEFQLVCNYQDLLYMPYPLS